ncbi:MULTISPECIES: plasmid replication protein RepC [Rhizobium]|uniref:Replication initiation protein RepC n=1 Tax=Rhizobium tropici TaxID=398 RepID=A0A329Y5B5_RHITR|nr:MULTISPECIES: plasmid replication protein RepC [Rhizobium]MBB3291124.1 replication initiation protein RepC [Rhizobium sp. BK252]MBB3405903.1 replication initiation protein RepC [Rhizobium sp. BK289]MBB3418457.1 replication initiation protein RepC [Rhizobium sp. BK284]MBB3486335.1 replication initiation protein RepC [Rhizobium sp. BK347]MDK4718905.1 plasmid replication protein RepC [Rhizobium sp. CNPSo 3968]
MEAEHVTTPFGRRPMTLAMLIAQRRADHGKSVRSVDKWKIYRALCEAKPLLGVTDRALAVLNALLSFYPKSELSDDANLIVFPSNAQLSLRAHGMAEQTIRRHLAVLIAAGLLVRRDSPNGKRYARRNRAGDLNEAYGFSLAPLLSRADEIEHLAAEVVAERLHMQGLREHISLHRRDIAKLIETAIAEDIEGPWEAVHSGFRALIDDLPRSPNVAQLETLLGKLGRLRDEIVNRLETHAETAKLSANPYQNERHIQNSDSESQIESEATSTKNASPRSFAPRTTPVLVNIPPASETLPPMPCTPDGSHPEIGTGTELKSFPLDLILRACPEITAYGPTGQIKSWRDLLSASLVVKSMLDVSPGTYGGACAAMGVENAATVIACILQRGSRINSAGAYLRDLTRRAEKGAFAIGPMLMSLLRANMAPAVRKIA